jgi:hypothetical protein
MHKQGGMMSESLFAWEVANLLGLSSSKFLRTLADEIPHQQKGGVRLYKANDVEDWQAGTLNQKEVDAISDHRSKSNN